MALAAGVVVLFPVAMYLVGRASIREDDPTPEAPSPQSVVERAVPAAPEAAAAPEAVTGPTPASPGVEAVQEASEPAAAPTSGGRPSPLRATTQPDTGARESDGSAVVLADGRSLQLEGIAWSKSVEIAVINGQGVARGETVEGFRLVDIDRGRVELRSDGEVITLRLRAEEPSPPQVKGRALVEAARRSVTLAPRYDASYAVIDYPLGDPGLDRGAGVDLVVRAFRELGLDLQQLMQEDIRRSQGAYGIGQPDPNLDHRRVRNQAVFFARHAVELARDREGDWRAGDIVLWDLTGDGLPNHIGILSDRITDAGLPRVIHHMRPGRGFGGRPSEDDVLFRWPVAHHFRWPSEPASD